MQGGTEQAPPVSRRMSDLRLVCEQEIRAHRQKAEDAAAAFRLALLAIRTKTEKNIADREKLSEAKLYLKELEDDLKEALIVKSCKEAKHAATSTSLSTAKARTEDLRETVENQRSRKAEYESMISLAMEELNQDDSKDDVDTEDTEGAISWYKKVLGFQTEGGDGVKFIFDKIHSENPDKEYSFTIRLNGDTYTLLQCDPNISDVKQLIDELNQTHGLFKFVRAMRRKFQAAALNAHSELSTVSVSSPLALANDNRNKFSSSLQNSRNKRLNTPIRSYSTRRASQSKSIEALRRSPRRKVNQML